MSLLDLLDDPEYLRKQNLSLNGGAFADTNNPQQPDITQAAARYVLFLIAVADFGTKENSANCKVNNKNIP